jgi:hypothetical protein
MLHRQMLDKGGSHGKARTIFWSAYRKKKLYLGIFPVGSGSFPNFSDFEAEFDGSYSAFGHSGTFKIGLKLTDQNAGSTSGPCQVTLNGKTDKTASYKVAAQKLTIKTSLNDSQLQIYKSQNGTQVDHISDHNIWIG